MSTVLLVVLGVRRFVFCVSLVILVYLVIFQLFCGCFWVPFGYLGLVILGFLVGLFVFGFCFVLVLFAFFVVCFCGVVLCANCGLF